MLASPSPHFLVRRSMISVYEDLGRLVVLFEREPRIRVVVLTAPLNARAWCGGADLNDFVGMDTARRRERYAFIKAQVPRFFRLDRPVIAQSTPLQSESA